MKRLLLAVVVCIALAVPALSEAGGTPWYKSQSLLSAVTATGTTGPATGAGRNKPFEMPISKHMCTVTLGGTAPTNVSAVLLCSEDGTNFASCATVTVTASPTVFHVDKPGVLYLEGQYADRSGGDATTSVTMTCTSGGI